jgi:hypothetical protein
VEQAPFRRRHGRRFVGGVFGAFPAASAAAAVGEDFPRVLRRWAAAWNTGDAAAMAALFTQTAQCWAVLKPLGLGVSLI